ncbi:restriction endonuclease subunit S, partial [bacterium]|nr:restriction endonuclease subunit S [candidate division CSSED10-310 bacterium]
MKRGYKETEIGEIPEEWDIAKLNEIATPIKEVVGDREIQPMSISAGIGFVAQSEKWGKEIAGKQYEKYIVLRAGQFAYNKGNSKQFPQGCVYLYNGKNPVSVPNVFISFTLDKTRCDNGFYQQMFLNNSHGIELVKYINSGTRNNGLLNLTPNNFYSICLVVPPLPEQKKIAEVLSSVDESIRAT